MGCLCSRQSQNESDREEPATSGQEVELQERVFTPEGALPPVIYVLLLVVEDDESGAAVGAETAAAQRRQRQLWRAQRDRRVARSRVVVDLFGDQPRGSGHQSRRSQPSPVRPSVVKHERRNTI